MLGEETDENLTIVNVTCNLKKERFYLQLEQTPLRIFFLSELLDYLSHYGSC